MSSPGAPGSYCVALITKEVLEKAPPATGSPYYIRETGNRGAVKGFMVRVMRTERRYGVRFRGAWYPIQRCDLMKPEDAREKARALLLSLIGDKSMTSDGAGGRRKRFRKVAELAETYLREVVDEECKPRTREEYRRLWRNHLLPYFDSEVGLKLGEMSVAQAVSTELGLRLRRHIRDTAAARSGKAEAAGHATSNRAMQQLSAAFGFAVNMKWIAENPFSQEVLLRLEEEPDSYSLSAEDYAGLGRGLRAAIQHRVLPWRTIVALILLLMTSARPSEVLGARLEWVKRVPPRIDLPTAKGDRRRSRKRKGKTLWLTPWLLTLIDSVKRPEGCPWVIPGDDPAQPFKDLEKAWNRVCKLGGVDPRATPKSARHGFRSAGPEVGVPPELMQQMLGHADLRMTNEVYLHVRDQALASSAEQMVEHLHGLLGLSPRDLPVEGDSAAVN